MPDGNNIPAYSMAAIVEGGDINAVAQAIALRKTPGSPTYGTTSVMVFDSRGLPSRINFFPLAEVPITVQIHLTALTGFSAIIENAIIAQVVAFINSLPIGYDCYLTKVIAATELSGDAGLTYEVTQVYQARGAATPGLSDIAIIYTEAATTNNSLITVNVSGSRTEPINKEGPTMSGFTDRTSQAILNHIVGKTAMFGLPQAFVALFTAVGIDAGTGFIEVIDGGYSRASTVDGDWNTAAGSAPSTIANANPLVFPTASSAWR